MSSERQARVRTKLARKGGKVITTNLGAEAVADLEHIQAKMTAKDGPAVSQRQAIEASLASFAKTFPRRRRG